MLHTGVIETVIHWKPNKVTKGIFQLKTHSFSLKKKVSVLYSLMQHVDIGPAYTVYTNNIKITNTEYTSITS